MESNNGKLILVTGITGKQGGATAKHLLAAGFKIRGLSRKPDGKKALLWISKGVEMKGGNLNKPESLKGIMDGVYGVFITTNFWEPGAGKRELQQAKYLADLAAQQQVSHVIMASVCRCDDNPDLAHFITKYQSEQYIRSLGLKFTFLRAVYFMDNLLPSDQGARFHWAVLPDILKSNTTLQMIATDDIGWFAAKAFLNPNEYANKTIDLAGDELTYPELEKTYIKVYGLQPRTSGLMKWFIMTFFGEIRKMMNWYKEPRFHANIDELRKLHPNLLDFESFLMQKKSKQI